MGPSSRQTVNSFPCFLVVVFFQVIVNNIALGDAANIRLIEILEANSRPIDKVARWPIVHVAGTQVYRDDGSVYLVIDRPLKKSPLTFPRLHNHVLTAVVLKNGAKPTAYNGVYHEADLVRLTQTPTHWTVHLPQNLTLPAVVAIDVIGPPRCPDGPIRITAAKNGEIVLAAHHAEVLGEGRQFTPIPHRNSIGNWLDEKVPVEWHFDTHRPAEFDVHILQACEKAQGGDRVRIQVTSEDHQASVRFHVVDTGHSQNFRWRKLGRIKLQDVGKHRLELAVEESASSPAIDVRQIRLSPISPRQPTDDDIRDVEPDCHVPPLIEGTPQAGRRVVHRLPGYPDSVYHTLYLPSNWHKNEKFPMIVELTGNGGYRNTFGDRCTGLAQDAKLGYGLVSNDRAIWICVPYLNDDGSEVVHKWWGTAPEYRPHATIQYLKHSIENACEQFGGDRHRIVLAGFSRGSIACNYLGLNNDDIATYWKGFVCFSHYDGILQAWPYSSDDEASAQLRLHRLQGRPQLIINETANGDQGMLYRVEKYLKSTAPDGQFEFLDTGFRNHSDEWVLRPSPARARARHWIDHVFVDSN